MKKRYTLLSFDVEEFDIPFEYGINITDEEVYSVSLAGLEEVLNLLDSHNITATFFTTASFALKNKKLLKDISKKHEIASHGVDHKTVTNDSIVNSKKILEEITGTQIIGFRSPRLQNVDNKILCENGYKYNSSENPIFLPGRYNNFFKKRTSYIKDGILNIPASASPIVRFPLFWLAFKNLPFPLIKFFSLWTLQTDKYLNIYYHPWEFADISKYNLPKIVKKHYGKSMLKRLDTYINTLKEKSEFITLETYCNLFKGK